MKVNFERVVVPCIVNDITLWHVEHGLLWDVVAVPSGRRIGVFFATLLCGDGSVIHFYAAEDIPKTAFLAAFRKALKMMSSYGNVIYATVPDEYGKLISVLCRAGFIKVPDGGFVRAGKNITLLKYLPGKKQYIMTNQQKGASS